MRVFLFSRPVNWPITGINNIRLITLMQLTADEIIDRRRLRRKVSFWRIMAFVILALMLVALAFASGISSKFTKGNTNHIARVSIEGVITNDKPMLDLLKSLEENKNVEAVILNISSPGGSTVGGEAMYEAVRAINGTKPVVTSVGTLATSAGYMIASGTDHIVARRSSIVGSIGVLFQYADVSQLLDKVGVKVDTVKSAPLKAEPSPFAPASEEAIAMIDRLVMDSYNWFVDLVSKSRGMDRAEVLKLADGSIFTGAQSLENGLIDAIGGESVAREWLYSEKKLDRDIEIIDYAPVRPEDRIFGRASIWTAFARIFGIEIDESSASAIEKSLKERLFLDGLVSIWHAPVR